jgi:hypothetical protein
VSLVLLIISASEGAIILESSRILDEAPGIRLGEFLGQPQEFCRDGVFKAQISDI